MSFVFESDSETEHQIREEAILRGITLNQMLDIIMNRGIATLEPVLPVKSSGEAIYQQVNEAYCLGIAQADQEAFVLCLALGTLEAMRREDWPLDAGIWTLARPIFWQPLTEVDDAVSDNSPCVNAGASIAFHESSVCPTATVVVLSTSLSFWFCERCGLNSRLTWLLHLFLAEAYIQAYSKNK
jgi:hypothetical protein